MPGKVPNIHRFAPYQEKIGIAILFSEQLTSLAVCCIIKRIHFEESCGEAYEKESGTKEEFSVPVSWPHSAGD